MEAKDLKPNPKNPRTISSEKLEQLKRALAEFGDLSGIVYNLKTKRLVGGHQRLKVIPPDAKIVITKRFDPPTKVGTTAEGYIELDGERFKYRSVRWDGFKEKAANIAANKGAGDWDLPQLADWMRELEAFSFDLDLTLFDADERSEILKVTETAPEPTGKEDEVPAAPKKAKTKPGDLYLLGKHRLVCGNSTNADDLDKLMNGARADICFTSPPYNLGKAAMLRGKNATGKKSVYREDTDEKSEAEYLQFMIDWSGLAIAHAQYLFCNVQMLAGNKLALCDYWHTFKNHLVDIMVWDKEHGPPAFCSNVLNSAWEFIFILTKDENPKRVIKSGEEFRGNIPNIFRLNPVGKKDELAKDHGAVFPVALAEYFVQKFTKESVLDMFGGSGTTMIAAERLGRKCFMMELDPIYCDVIVERWEKYTGKKAKLK